MSMLEYCKVILESVSFDHALFLKELRKASNRLHKPEAEELMIWCISRYNYP
jgi:hypothetical protein